MLITPGLDIVFSTPPGALGDGIDDFFGAVLLEGKLDGLPIRRDFDVEASRTEAPVPIFVQEPSITVGLWILLRLGLRIRSSLGLTSARSFRRVSSRNQG